MHAFSGVQELNESEGLDEGMDVLKSTPDNPEESNLATPLETQIYQPVEELDPPLAADLPIGGGGSFWVLQPVLCVVKVVKKPHQARHVFCRFTAPNTRRSQSSDPGRATRVCDG